MLLRGVVLRSGLCLSNIVSCLLEKGYLLLDPFLSGRASRPEVQMQMPCLEHVTCRGPDTTWVGPGFALSRCSSHHAEREAEAHRVEKKGLSCISYSFLSNSQKKKCELIADIPTLAEWQLEDISNDTLATD